MSEANARDKLTTARCCQLTGQGRSAIAVVALWQQEHSAQSPGGQSMSLGGLSPGGQSTHQIIASMVKLATDRPLKAGEIRYGHWTGTEHLENSGTENSGTEHLENSGTEHLENSGTEHLEDAGAEHSVGAAAESVVILPLVFGGDGTDGAQRTDGTAGRRSSMGTEHAGTEHAGTEQAGTEQLGTEHLRADRLLGGHWTGTEPLENAGTENAGTEHLENSGTEHLEDAGAEHSVGAAAESVVILPLVFGGDGTDGAQRTDGTAGRRSSMGTEHAGTEQLGTEHLRADRLLGGFDAVEIHCHGGLAAVDRILRDLMAVGCQLGTADEYVLADEREFTGLPASGDYGVAMIRSEAMNILGKCVTARTASIALDQLRGGLWEWCGRQIEVLNQNTSEQVCRSIADQAREISRLWRVGSHLIEPFSVVLAGPPNVGKSSLLNAIVGFDRSITLNRPGTTRDVLTSETVIDGWPIRFADTAGIRTGGGQIEQAGIERAHKVIENADLVVVVSQPGVTASNTINLDSISKEKRLCVLNKADLITQATDDAADINELTTVATTGEGIESLMSVIVHQLIADPPSSGSAVPITERQHIWLQKIANAYFADEILKLLRQLIG